ARRALRRRHRRRGARARRGRAEGHEDGRATDGGARAGRRGAARGGGSPTRPFDYILSRPETLLLPSGVALIKKIMPITLDHLGELERTHSCGELRASDAGREVVLLGWVAVRRAFGPPTFRDLRDRDGLTQVVFDAEDAPDAHARAKEVRGEYVVAVRGQVVLRQEGQRNPKL